MSDLTKLAVGFVLTTLCGGLLGFMFQRRHARYQWIRSRWEKELEETQALFDEVSRLLDRRLYRTRRLVWSLNRDKETQQKRLEDYTQIVFEWNDNINRILAMVYIYFGKECRNLIDHSIGTELAAIGGSIEKALREKTSAKMEELENRTNVVASSIYRFNLRLLREIQDRRNSLVASA